MKELETLVQLEKEKFAKLELQEEEPRVEKTAADYTNATNLLQRLGERFSGLVKRDNTQARMQFFVGGGILKMLRG